MCNKDETVVQQEAQPTEQEQRLLDLDVEARERIQPQQLALQETFLELGQALGRGSTDLPGFLGDIGRGISPELTQEISQQAVQDILPSFQSAGILDSGVAASIAAETAGGIRRGAAEFNIGNKLNLLNLALGGQAQIQQPLLQQQGMLGQQLAGLRTQTQTTTAMNPFIRSFQQSLGQTLGGGNITKGSGFFGV